MRKIKILRQGHVKNGGGHSHMEVTGMCGHDPQSRGLSVTD